MALSKTRASVDIVLPFPYQKCRDGNGIHARAMRRYHEKEAGRMGKERKDANVLKSGMTMRQEAFTRWCSWGKHHAALKKFRQVRRRDALGKERSEYDKACWDCVQAYNQRGRFRGGKPLAPPLAAIPLTGAFEVQPEAAAAWEADTIRPEQIESIAVSIQLVGRDPAIVHTRCGHLLTFLDQQHPLVLRFWCARCVHEVSLAVSLAIALFQALQEGARSDRS